MQTQPLDPDEEARVAALMRSDRQRLGRDPEDPYAAYDERSSREEVAADHEPDLDELLADPEVAAEADRILAGEGGTILGIPFAPSKPESERGE